MRDRKYAGVDLFVLKMNMIYKVLIILGGLKNLLKERW